MSFSSSNAALGSFILDDRMLNLGNCPIQNASTDIQRARLTPGFGQSTRLRQPPHSHPPQHPKSKQHGKHPYPAGPLQPKGASDAHRTKS